MVNLPEYNTNLSIRLSAVLDDIGVNETMVKKRRRTWLLLENIYNFRYQKMFLFGSQTEGSTTEGLFSDFDALHLHQRIKVLQNWKEWESGKINVLMVKDDKTSPGYCLLQVLKPAAKLLVPNNSFTKDSSGRVFLNHSVCLTNINGENIRHGPAFAFKFPTCDFDLVVALHCSTFPKEAETWLQQQSKSGWPTEDMKRQFAEHGCFLVAVASKTGVYQDLEFRISTCLTERHLMFSLNITQMRCYILLKMIVKTFLKPTCDIISSFMCKNILFHCITDLSTNNTCTDRSLLTLLNQCLKALYNCILEENCPHFLIPQNNLLAGKLSENVKHQLVEIMCNLIENIDKKLLEIGTDDLGKRLAEKSGDISTVCLSSAYDIANINVLHLFLFIQEEIFRTLRENISKDDIIVYTNLINRVFKLSQADFTDGPLKQVASRLITPFLCSVVGSIEASIYLQHGHDLSPESIIWFLIGRNSDVSSGKLKLASALYCTGYLEHCEEILLDVKLQMEQTTVQSMCNCYEHDYEHSSDFKKMCYEKNEEALKSNLAFCIRFLPCEINCSPIEFKYEMFRSIEEDQPYRGENDFWMDWAVADSLPYLFFMQYKVYRKLQRPAEKIKALGNLAYTIYTDNDIWHKETAWNLMGQCFERENDVDSAFFCYIQSLKIRTRNNAAKWHVCILLARLIASA